MDLLDSIPPARLPFPVTRAVALPVEARASEGMPTMVGHFSTFGDWYEVNSHLEGHFLERISERAFNKTIAESRSNMKVLYDHGQDPQIGNKVLGPINELRTEAEGPYYEVPLFDTSYNRDLAPGLEAGVYGSSFRFAVEKDDWDHAPERSDHNPDALPERTITEARVFEFGPVTFPANPAATAGTRSTTDTYYKRSRDPEQFEALLRSAQVARTPKSGAADQASEPPSVTPAEPTRTDTPPPPTPSQETTPVEYNTREEKAARLSELKDIIARTAEEYSGEMPADVESRWDEDNAEHDQLVRDINAWDKRAARVADIGKDPERTEPTFAAPAVHRAKSVEDIYDLRSVDTSNRSPEARAQILHDNAKRSIDSTYMPKGSNTDALLRFLENEQSDVDEFGNLHQEATRRILLTGNPQYRRAFAKYLKDGNTSGFTPEEQRAAALAVTGTTTTGGYAVPYVFDPTFIHIGAHTSINPYRAACRVETISGGNNWRAVTATAITAKWDAEAAASVEGGPTIGQPTFTVQRADAFATVSIETLQDRPDVTEELSSLFAEAKDNLEENSFTLGVGTTVYPQGMFLSGAFTVQSTATNDVTAITDTLLVEAALPLRHRMNAAWFMSRSTQRQLEALDTTGYYFKRPGQFFAAGSDQPANVATGNTGTQLLGYPIWEVPSAVSTLTTDAAVIAVFGDPRNYVIVDRIGLSVEVVPLMLNGATPSFPTGQRGIYCYWRATARALNVDGMRQLDVN